MSIEDIGGEIAGGLEVLFHHPLRPIKDYHLQVDTNLWRGSWPEATDLMWLKTQGVTLVVNLCKERSQDIQVRDFKMMPYNIPILDGSSPTSDQAEEFLDRTEDPVSKIYVHCEAGHGRTGCMVAYYRVKVQGWTVGSALQEAQFIGHLEPNQVKWIQGIK